MRHVLDFDFEKLCSMTLSGDNVYCDLVDGKFFQGRGKDTPAYRRRLESLSPEQSCSGGCADLRPRFGEGPLRLDECCGWEGLLHSRWL